MKYSVDRADGVVDEALEELCGNAAARGPLIETGKTNSIRNALLTLGPQPTITTSLLSSRMWSWAAEYLSRLTSRILARLN